jgi:CheY-like chemotaxis protein
VSNRLLIVDDSPSFLRASRRLLEREGLTVVGVASSTAEALRCAEAHRPDVVLVDVFLGEESGFDLARRFVSHGQGACPTVILISTHAKAEFEDLVEASPAVGFLPKLELSADAISRIVNTRSR